MTPTGTLYLLLFYSFVYMCAAPDIGLRPEYCDPGYFGFFCADICPYPYHGKYCDYTCSCGEKYCRHVDGCIRDPVSTCPVGFFGSYCESKCSFPFFGQGCQQKCLCAQEDCHYSTGCHRKLAFSKNPASLKTLTITKVTTSEKSPTPLSVAAFWTRLQSTVSECSSGFIGHRCELKCRFPNYGHGCEQRCLCLQKDCHFLTGCQRTSAAQDKH